MEEYVPGMLKSEPKVFAAATVSGGQGSATASVTASATASVTATVGGQSASQPMNKKPLRGIFAIGANSPKELKDKLDDALPPRRGRLDARHQAARSRPTSGANERLVIDFGDHDDLFDKLGKARKAAGFDNPAAWKALQARASSAAAAAKPGKIAFLFPGQGSQYINMGRCWRSVNPSVAQVFKDADVVMTPILGKPLTSFIFADSADPEAMKKAELTLMQTAITQPAMLTMDTALYKLLAEYGFAPDMVMGHSLGEYAALIAAGIMPFAARAGSLRRARRRDDQGQHGRQRLDGRGDGAATKSSRRRSRRSTATSWPPTSTATTRRWSAAPARPSSRPSALREEGLPAMRIPVSHAFHTKIVAPASKPLRKVLDRLRISRPLPLVANVTGDIYPTTVEASRTSWSCRSPRRCSGSRGWRRCIARACAPLSRSAPSAPSRAFVDDVLGTKPDVWSLLTNHPKNGELESFNQALCGLYAAGYGMEGRGARGRGASSSVPSCRCASAASRQ
jgi:acyl transferase domain-containing protein